MSADGQIILGFLARVSAERAERALDPALAQRVLALKAYQHARFERTYADLAAQPRYAAAVRFFLDDLYGPTDFTERDAQFKRIVPALVRLFPAEIVGTVRLLAELHALSEELDTRMARCLAADVLDDRCYGEAWRAIGQRADRERQITLTLGIGQALDRYTRNPLLRHSLRLMRGPAQAAGLGALQQFLEHGFDTFRGLRGAEAFLAVIGERERTLAAGWFDDGSDARADASPV